MELPRPRVKALPDGSDGCSADTLPR